MPIAAKAAWAHGAGVASSIPRGSQQHRLGDGDATCRDGSRRWKWTRVRHDQSANRRRWTMYRRGIVGGRIAGLRGTRTEFLSVGGTEEAIRHRNHIDRMGKDLDWEGKRTRWENGEKVSMEGTDISMGKEKKAMGEKRRAGLDDAYEGGSRRHERTRGFVQDSNENACAFEDGADRTGLVSPGTSPLSLRRRSSLRILRHPRTTASATSMDTMRRTSLSADGRSVAGRAFARLARAETRSATRRRRFAPTVSFARIPHR